MSTGLHEFITQTIDPLLRAAGIEARAGAPRLLRDHDLEFLTHQTDDWGLTAWYRETEARRGPVFSVTADLQGNARAAEIHGVIRVTAEPPGLVMVDPLSGNRLCGLPGQPVATGVTNLWHVFRGAVCPVLYQGAWRFWPDPRDARIWQAQQLRRIRRFYEPG